LAPIGRRETVLEESQLAPALRDDAFE